ncbi:HTH domain-containing protein [Clostridium sp. OS1-26]|uniref:BglG family transcription antiterminator n=1 Tax=Clostridium sp. OS1-26 TaxID=3070681 RepID=UPI0027DF74E9|nr:HTH domain-containing protein [Clostridium sp. OS1-26]WML32947.1 HTH domain-containing protein [Clostridium sp. OS1-26]
MITRKHSMLVRFLSEKDEYVTALELGKKLEVSTRTIKRYIKDLNYLFKDYGVEISSIKGVGYKLSGSSKGISKIVEKAERQIKGLEIDDSTEGRINAAICIMLNKEYINAQRLADELNLSIPSTNKLITNIKELLKKYDLRIISKPYHGSKIVGDELNIRYLILDTAIKMDEKENIKVKLENIPSKELKIIEDTISKYLKENNVVISDNDFNILMTRIIVSISRAKNGNVLKNDLFQDVYRLHNYKLIYKIMSELFDKLKITFDEREILYVSNYSGVIIYNYNMSKQFNENMAEEIKSFLKESLEEISLISGK